MTSDSQPVDIAAGYFQMPVRVAKVGSHIVRARAGEFNGLAGYVGTEVIRGQPTRQWMQAAVTGRQAPTLRALCAELAEELTAIWQSDRAETHLSIFLAGYERGIPQFWWVSNGDVPAPSASSVPLEFDAVNDLGEQYYAATAQPGESLEALVARTQPTFRRGVLAVARIFDGFSSLVGQTIADGHAEIPPIDSLERFAAYTKFRFEFAKRMFDPKYGLATMQHAPVAGEVHVFSVDPSGTTRAHGKHVGQSRIVP